MASSKYPVDWAPVPQAAIDSGLGLPGVVFCNLRPGQRPEQPEEDGHTRMLDSFRGYDTVHEQVQEFLRSLPKETTTRLILHFQGYGLETGTAVVEAKVGCWISGSEPRLDFDKPNGMSDIHGCPNFWGPFILAIAAVGEDCEVACYPDSDGSVFAGLVFDHAISLN